jgi:hypothetical protein
VRSRLLFGLTLASLLVVACSKPKSFIVLTLKSADPTTAILGVTKVVVTVTQAPSLSKVLNYPVGDEADGGPKTLSIAQAAGNDLSVSFTGGRTGLVDVSVAVYDATGCSIGFVGDVSVSIREGSSTAAEVLLQPQKDCTMPDAGVDAPGGDTFPGCDPAAPAQQCSTTQTCQVDCTTEKGECTPGGKGGPGAPCTTNKDCAPGSQCFDYSGTGCTGVRVCLSFCHDDNGCRAAGASTDAGAASTDAGAEAGAGDAGGAEGGAVSGSGTTSVCQGLVPCGQGLTGYHTCTFACDPRAQAVAAGTSGCPTGLACIVVANMDQVDCACAGATRTGVDDQDCVGGSQCAPGFICNEMASVKKCRAVCRCDAKGMTCMTNANDCGNKACSALTNDTTFGVCL